MKKWFPAFLFLSLSGGNDALAGWHNVMFYAFNDYLTTNAGNVKVIDQPQLYIPWNTGSATATYYSCSGPEFASGVYFQEYLAWMVVPKHVYTNEGFNIFLDVQSKYGWSMENENDKDFYFFINGYEWDTWTNNGARICFYPGNMKQLNNKFNDLVFRVLLPVDLPKGHYNFPVRYIRGIQHHYYDLWQDHYKMPYDQIKQLPATNTLMLSFDNVGGCQPSTQVLNIDHGSIVIDRANGNIASQTLSIYCDVPVSVKISLLRNTPPIYNNNKFSVGLGNGWDSIISLDGVEQSEEILRWYTAGSKTVKIESRLYGEEGKRKPGELSGSMTMVLSFP
ncbi:P fimbria tip G-adhesin PapG-I [Escherichia coli]|nr:P fimbria tip G-adhesin PapG-I [Escherichia coli]